MAITATGTQINRSNIQLPNSVSSEILQKTQEASIIMRLARQIPLPGNGVQIPVIASDPSAEWVTETGAKPVSTPTLDKKIMQAHKLAVIVPFSNEFRRDAANLYTELVRRLPLALAQKFDSTCFFGSAPGSNFDLLASVTAQNLGAGAWQALIDADMAIAANNGDLNAFAISPSARGILLCAKDIIGRPLFVNSTAEGTVPVVLGRHPQFLSPQAGGSGIDVLHSELLFQKEVCEVDHIMTGVFHTDRMLSSDKLLYLRVEQFEAFLIIIEEERFDENFAGLVIKYCSAVLELTDIDTDVDHDVYTPFDQ